MTVDLLYLVQHFLQQQSLSKPLLLALSGGPDSLCLFYALLNCQKRLSFTFHVAHVDHGWRVESAQEAILLESLMKKHQIPFHKKVLNPHLLKGNLEDACRQARYCFFKELYQTYQYEAVILGHQADDQAETVLKRLLEGAHWTKLTALQSIAYWEEMPLWRPFLTVSKKEILEWLKQKEIVAFEDATNQDEHFLRARMRRTLFPLLNREFGKEVQHPLRSLAEDIQEIKDYFEIKLTPILAQENRGPFGVYLDFSELELTSLEIKYLIRKMGEKEGIVLSRPIVEAAASFIKEGVANRQLRVGHRTIWIDRFKLFILDQESIAEWALEIPLLPGSINVGNWKIDVHFTDDPHSVSTTSWQEGWKGEFRGVLPLQEGYHLGPSQSNICYRSHRYSVSKWWNNHKVPAFLWQKIPVIWKEGTIYHEFLTDYLPLNRETSENWVAIKLYFSL